MTPGEFLLLYAAVLSVVAVAIIQNIKWVRVAQRVHYLPGEVSRLQRLWFERRPLTIVLWVVSVVLAVTAVHGATLTQLPSLAWAAILAPLPLVFTPWRMPLRGVTSRLSWTKRAIRVAVVAVIVQIIVGVLGWWVLGLAGLLVPLLLQAHLWDLALAIMEPIERRISYRFVADARRKLKRVHPTVVAITGSYGKTSTKGYVAHMVGSTHQTVASPASFNNLMGLSRAINEHLVVGTGVFVAEMGMNQEGQIRELTKLFPPDIAAITIIGEAHMERLGSKEAIFRAKSEITDNASTVVLPVDQPELVALIEKCRRDGKTVITVSGKGNPADIILDPERGSVRYGPDDSETTIDVPPFGHAINIAVALGIAWALEVPKGQALARLGSLPVAAHRAEAQPTKQGVLIIDDTYNSNPVGSTHAVREALVMAQERGGPLVVVTPGMVELGPVQVERNSALAQEVMTAGGTLMIVGRTNRRALLDGAGGNAEVFEGRADAVEAALRVAGDKGVILYENDLPDHYP